MFATIDDNKCIECGLCLKVCPSVGGQMLYNRHDNPFVGPILNTYIGHSTNSNVYANAQSGGASTAIISYLFDAGLIDGAILCRMSYGVTPTVEGVLVENVDEIMSCQKSCYTPVDLLSALKNSESKKSLAIVGLPCHIEGSILLSQHIKRFDNIKYRIGLVCDRTLCSTIMDVMKSYTVYDDIMIHWRCKDAKDGQKQYSYSNAPVMIKSANGEKTVLPRDHRIVLKELFTQPRCRVCYDKINTHADIVLGDPWNISGMNSVRGDSVVVVRSETGQEIIDKMIKGSYMTLKKQSDFEEFINGQGMVNREKSVKKMSYLFSVWRGNAESYLVSQGTAADVMPKDRADVKLYEQFQENEQKDKDQIVKLARKQISAYQFSNTLVGRVIRKIKNIVCH